MTPAPPTPSYSGTTSYSQGLQQAEDNQRAENQWRFGTYRSGDGLQPPVGTTPPASAGVTVDDKSATPPAAATPPQSGTNTLAWSPGQDSTDVNQAGGGAPSATNTPKPVSTVPEAGPDHNNGRTDLTTNPQNKPDPVI